MARMTNAATMRERDAWLADQGWRVMRVSNDDVFNHLNAVLDAIMRAVEEGKKNS